MIRIWQEETFYTHLPLSKLLKIIEEMKDTDPGSLIWGWCNATTYSEALKKNIYISELLALQFHRNEQKKKGEPSQPPTIYHQVCSL